MSGPVLYSRDGGDLLPPDVDYLVRAWLRGANDGVDKAHPELPKDERPYFRLSGPTRYDKQWEPCDHEIPEGSLWARTEWEHRPTIDGWDGTGPVPVQGVDVGWRGRPDVEVLFCATPAELVADAFSMDYAVRMFGLGDWPTERVVIYRRANDECLKRFGMLWSTASTFIRAYTPMIARLGGGSLRWGEP